MHRHRTLLAKALAPVVAAAAGGCEPGSPPEQGPGPGGPVIGLEPDFRIGVVEGPEELQFGAIGALAVDSAGAVYVGDRDNYEVRKFEYDLPAGATSPSSGDTYWGNGPGATFEVFSERGEYLGRAELPMDVWSDPDEPVSVPPVITRDHLWAVALDSLNVQYVTRFRINWAAGTGD